MNKSKLLKTTVATVALVALVTGGYVYKNDIQRRIARTTAVVTNWSRD